jgi:hypothetical protein
MIRDAWDCGSPNSRAAAEKLPNLATRVYSLRVKISFTCSTCPSIESDDRSALGRKSLVSGHRYAGQDTEVLLLTDLNTVYTSF